jgi:hypothetical protein
MVTLGASRLPYGNIRTGTDDSTTTLLPSIHPRELVFLFSFVLNFVSLHLHFLGEGQIETGTKYRQDSKGRKVGNEWAMKSNF